MSTSLVKPLSPPVPCEQGYYSVHSVATWKHPSFKACSVFIKQSFLGLSTELISCLRPVFPIFACAHASLGDLVKIQTLILWVWAGTRDSACLMLICWFVATRPPTLPSSEHYVSQC